LGLTADLRNPAFLLDLWLKFNSQGVERYPVYTLNKAQPLLTLLDFFGLQKKEICAVADWKPETYDYLRLSHCEVQTENHLKFNR
tara:strand:- start:99 stop:353 length:255 start_codon:yes stop_codon:yes gene_type:complete